MLNQVILIGRITAKPEVKTYGNDKKYTKFTLACQRSYKNTEGNYDTDFIQITAWSPIAELVGEYVNKGDLIAVKGRIQNNEYTLESGEKRKTNDIIAEKVTFLTSSAKKEKIESEMQNQETGSIKQDEIELSDDDLPF